VSQWVPATRPTRLAISITQWLDALIPDFLNLKLRN
jgi:hypothetical protein